MLDDGDDTSPVGCVRLHQSCSINGASKPSVVISRRSQSKGGGGGGFRSDPPYPLAIPALGRFVTPGNFSSKKKLSWASTLT
jgi:hypothetical protein